MRFGRAPSGRAIRYKSSQSSAIATLYCGLSTTIPHANAVKHQLICKYSLNSGVSKSQNPKLMSLFNLLLSFIYQSIIYPSIIYSSKSCNFAKN